MIGCVSDQSLRDVFRWIALPQKSFISFSPTFRLGFSIIGLPNHFNGFSRQVCVGS